MQHNHYAYVITAAASLTTAGNYSIMIWCNYQIYNFLKVQKRTAVRKELYYEIQSQITKTFIAQAITPLIMVHIPLVFLFMNMYVFIEPNPEISAISILTFGYLPTINALSILFFVKTYRTQIVVIIKTVFQKYKANKVFKMYTIPKVVNGNK